MHIKQIENGWSSNVLELHIQGGLMERSGRSVNNFRMHFPLRIPIWLIKCLKPLICMIFLGQICLGERLRLNVN